MAVMLGMEESMEQIIQLNVKDDLNNQLAQAAVEGKKYALLPLLPLKEQKDVFQALKKTAQECGITLLIKTAGQAADTDALLKALSGMKGAGVYWSMQETLSLGEPFRTTYKALERFIKVIQPGSGASAKESTELIKKQGYKGIWME